MFKKLKCVFPYNTEFFQGGFQGGLVQILKLLAKSERKMLASKMGKTSGRSCRDEQHHLRDNRG